MYKSKRKKIKHYQKLHHSCNVSLLNSSFLHSRNNFIKQHVWVFFYEARCTSLSSCKSLYYSHRCPPNEPTPSYFAVFSLLHQKLTYHSTYTSIGAYSQSHFSLALKELFHWHSDTCHSPTVALLGNYKKKQTFN